MKILNKWFSPYLIANLIRPNIVSIKPKSNKNLNYAYLFFHIKLRYLDHLKSTS